MRKMWVKAYHEIVSPELCWDLSGRLDEDGRRVPCTLSAGHYGQHNNKEIERCGNLTGWVNHLGLYMTCTLEAGHGGKCA